MKKYVVMNNSKTTAQEKRQGKSLKERVADAIVALYIITALLTSLYYSMLFGSWGISFGGIVWTSLTTYGTLALYRAMKRDWH